ncbi:MAG: MGMT family protein [Anaerolineales bacterium]|nr:MGMT family protein [Anaerolineales bacterium]
MPEIPTLPDPEAFFAEVWEIIRKIPHGKIASYGQIAKMLPVPAGVDGDTFLEFGALWVSNAVAASPNDVPWQRVVNSKGEITERDGVAARRQRLMLQDEGVTFNPRGRIDMKRYSWNGMIK